MTEEPQPSEILKLSLEYQDKLIRMARETTDAIASLDKIRLHFEKSIYEEIKDWIKTLSPFILVFIVFIVFRSAHCGSVLEFLNIKLVAPACSQNEIQR